MTVGDCLSSGGLPHEWTIRNLQWLAQAHRDLARAPGTPLTGGQARAYWHIRWAAFLEDLLESRLVHRH